MAKSTFEKSILKLKHDILLTYLSIAIILIVTSYITITVGLKDFWTMANLITITIFELVAIVIVIIFFHLNFNDLHA